MTRRILLALIALFVASPAFAAFSSDRISVTVQGDGPDVVLIPGLTSSPAAWTATPILPPGYRYHLVQVKGFAGVPAAANASGDVAAPVAEEIARYVTATGLRHPALVGHSMGGTIALMIAARHPGLPSRVMVVDMVPFMGAVMGGPGTTVESIRPTADAMLKAMQAAAPEDRSKRLAEMTGAMVNNTTLRPLVVKSALDSDPAVVASSYHELMVTDMTPELPRITVPVTVLYVTPKGVPYSDEQIDAGYRSFYAGVKGIKLVRIPDSAHFIMYDNPTRFRTELASFLKG